MPSRVVANDKTRCQLPRVRPTASIRQWLRVNESTS